MNKSERLSKNPDRRTPYLPQQNSSQEGLFILPENMTPHDLKNERPPGGIEPKKGGFSFGSSIATQQPSNAGPGPGAYTLPSQLQAKRTYNARLV